VRVYLRHSHSPRPGSQCRGFSLSLGVLPDRQPQRLSMRANSTAVKLWMCCLAHTCRQATRCSLRRENISSFEGHYCRALRTLSAPSFRVRNSPATQKAITCQTNHIPRRPSITSLRRSPIALPLSSTARTTTGRPKSTLPKHSSTPRQLASIPSKRIRSLTLRSNCHGRPGDTPAFRLSRVGI
jgi:hypothetical protein